MQRLRVEAERIVQLQPLECTHDVVDVDRYPVHCSLGAPDNELPDIEFVRQARQVGSDVCRLASVLW